MADHKMVGKMGRVTGIVGPHRLGKVMVPVRGGTEHFHAYAAEGDDTTLARGTRVVVVEYFPPRTVVVTPL